MSYIIETGRGYVTLECIINRLSTEISEARCFASEGEANQHAEYNSLLDYMVVPRFAHTLAALDIWDAKSPERSEAWATENIKTDADVTAALQRDDKDAAEVQEAFFQDTHTINCRDNCGLVSIQELIRMSGWKKS